MQAAEIQQLQDQIKGASGFVRNLRLEIGRYLVGQERLVDRLLVALVANGHVLVEGLPGLAKTLAIRLLGQTTGMSFARLQFTPDLLPADVVGTLIYDPGTHQFSVRRGPVFANLVLADEINRAPAKVQSALLEAMQERQVTLGGDTQALPHPFMVMATQNPIEQEGTYPLPEAQVDRFMMKVELDYPKRAEEAVILERMAHPEVAVQATAVCGAADIIAARGWVDRIYLDPKISDYILDIVFATRAHQRDQLSPRQAEAKLDRFAPLIQYGASPRATLALALGAKAMAFLEGRAYVVPQDVKGIAPDVLRHRLVPAYEAEAEGLDSGDLIRQLLDELRTP